MTSQDGALEPILKTVKPTLFKSFVTKWSMPEHHPSTHHRTCRQTLVVDGCWKIFRQKCAYEHIVYKPPDLPVIWTGCLETPSRGSYYCKDHAGNELCIDVNGQIKKFKPNEIRITKLSIYIFISIYKFKFCIFLFLIKLGVLALKLSIYMILI